MNTKIQLKRLALLLTLGVFGVTGVNAQYTYTDTDESGLIVIEAEHYYELITGSGDYAGGQWLLSTELTGYSGEGYMAAPDYSSGIGDASDALESAPGVTYKVNITQTGTYYWYARCSYADGSSDSYHIAAEDTVLMNKMNPYTELAENYDTWGYNKVNASGSQAALRFSTTGEHTFTVLMREGNFRLDKIVLAPAADYDADTEDPAETDHSGVGIVVNELSNSLSVYPNPVVSATTISYDVINSGNVNVSVYSITGQLVQVLVNESMTAGNQQVTWNTESNVPAGIYYVKVDNDSETAVSKIIVQ